MRALIVIVIVCQFFFGQNKPKGAFMISPTSIEFNYDTSPCLNNTVNLTTSASWTATPSAEWIHVDLGGGTGNQTITVTTDANAGAARNRTVTFAATGFSSIICNISQTANGDDCS